MAHQRDHAQLRTAWPRPLSALGSAGRALVLCAALGAALAACNNVPTLPLPPPVASVGEPNVQGLVTVEGYAKARAFVAVFNERLEAGVITRADTKGFFSVDIEAGAGDLLTVWQEVDGDTGERTQVVVPEPK
jgi:hypothetical protein